MLKHYNHYHYEKNGFTYDVATTKYHGHSIKGVARCNPSDEYKVETGIKLAILRCEEKAAKIRARELKEETMMATEYAQRAADYARKIANIAAEKEAEYRCIQDTIKELVETL